MIYDLEWNGISSQKSQNVILVGRSLELIGSFQHTQKRNMGQDSNNDG